MRMTNLTIVINRLFHIAFKKNRFYSLLVAICLVVGLVHSCKNYSRKATVAIGDQIAPVSLDLEEIKARGKLVALVGNSSSSYFIYRGRPMGFEYEMLLAFAKDLGVTLEVVIPEDMNDLFDMLNSGEGDLIAASLTVTKERAEMVKFSDYLMKTRQVLVQRKPDGWQRMNWDKIRRQLIRNQLDLIGKEVHVRRNSSYFSRLKSLSDEIGGDIKIQTVAGDIETEVLIKKVAEGEIDFTVADEHIAQLNATYYANLDVATPISFPQQLAWASRKNSPQLINAINDWLSKARKSSDFHHLVMKYYKNRKGYLARSSSGYHSQFGGRLSIYDDIFKKQAANLGWDWRLVASIAYQESKFNHQLVSWAGASGLMQLMPETAKRFGGDSSMTAEQSVKVGVRFLTYLDDYWKDEIPDSAQRLPFVLASYNAGLGHILDARRLAEKYGNSANTWGDVSFFLLNKSERRFYSDPVSRHGYCRGTEPVKYVSEISGRYEQYKKLIPLALKEEQLLATK